MCRSGVEQSTVATGRPQGRVLLPSRGGVLTSFQTAGRPRARTCDEFPGASHASIDRVSCLGLGGGTGSECRRTIDANWEVGAKQVQPRSIATPSGRSASANGLPLSFPGIGVEPGESARLVDCQRRYGPIPTNQHAESPSGQRATLFHAMSCDTISLTASEHQIAVRRARHDVLEIAIDDLVKLREEVTL